MVGVKSQRKSVEGATGPGKVRGKRYVSRVCVQVPCASLLRPLVEYGVALTPLALLLRPLLAAGAAGSAAARDISGATTTHTLYCSLTRSRAVLISRHLSCGLPLCACAVVDEATIHDSIIVHIYTDSAVINKMKDGKDCCVCLYKKKILSDYRKFCYE